MADITVTTDFSQVNNLKEALQSADTAYVRVVDSVVRENNRLKSLLKKAAKDTEETNKIKEQADAIYTAKLQQEADKRERVRAREAAKAEKEAQRIEAANQKLIASEVKLRAESEKRAAASAQGFQSQIGSNLGLGARGISASASGSAFEGEIERLRQKYDQVYASSQLYERSLNELNKAHALGVLSAKQHEAAVESLNLEYQNFQNGVAQTGNRFAQYTAQSAGRMNQFGVVTQQAGYQIGDFLVQVQSGTNWMVAFGQQATQLVGVLPLMGAGFMGLSAGALVALSAGLGIAIPLVTAIGAAFMRTSKSAEDGVKSVDKQKEAYDGLANAISNARLEQGMASSGLGREQIVALAQLNALESQRTMLLLEQEELGAKANQEIDSFQTSRQEALTAEIALNAENIAKLEGQLKVARDILTAETQSVEHAERYYQILQEQDALNKERDADVKSLIALRNEEYNRLVQERDMLQAIYTFGKDSVEVRELEAQIAREAYQNELERKGLKGNFLTLLMDEYELTAAVKKEMEDMSPLQREINEYAQQFAQTDLASGVDAAAAAALALAERLGISLDRAKGMMELGYGAPVQYDPRAADYDPARASAGRAAQLQKDRFGFSYSDTVTGTKFADDETGGGREAKLRKQIDLTKELTQVEKDRQTILQSIEGSLESGFMSMVDGTKSVKSAFKSMAAEIIKELYRVLVVQRLVGGISGAVNMLTLPAGPSTGTLGLPKFATGGSMMPGGSYIVGENGPELVIPRHSGTVVNANQTANAMGGGGGFTQNLSINVSGSDSAMVRTEIAKMIPQITNATKAAVIDAKQRGGQMSAAFR